MKKIRILLIEQSPIVAAGFADLLRDVPDFDLVAVEPNMDHVPERVVVCKPDLVVLNPLLVDYSKRYSFRTSANLRQLPVVALVSSYVDPLWLKSFNGILEILDDGPKIVKKLNEVVQNSMTTDSQEVDELSDRERDVLVELAKGLTSKEIAANLHISVHTVVTHRKNIIRKTGIKSVAGLTVYAMLNNLIE